MKLIIYNKDGKAIKTINGVLANGLKTMVLGIPKRQVLMFKHQNEAGTFSGSIDLLSEMTFSLYNE